MLVDMNKDRALRAEAFSREIFALDQNSQLYEAEQKGKAEGIKEGLAKGIQEGLMLGEANRNIAIAKKLFESGQTKEFISSITGLSLDELDNILK